MITQDQIEVKFHPEMIRAMFDCGKDRTSRFKKLGQVGNKFPLTHPETGECRTWEITDINQQTLGKVASQMYNKEGFVSEEDFMRFWRKLYPTRSSVNLLLYVHMLKETKSDRV